MPTTGVRFVALKEGSRPRTVLVVDLGYSSKRRSCGIALSPGRLDGFGDALFEVFLAELDKLLLGSQVLERQITASWIAAAQSAARSLILTGQYSSHAAQ